MHHSIPKILFADPSHGPGGPQHVGNIILTSLSQYKYHLVLGSPIKNHPLNKSIEFRHSPEIHNIGKPTNLRDFVSTVINFPSQVVSLCKYIKQNDIALIHSNNEICFTTSVAARLTGTSHVIHVHGLGFSNSVFRFIFGKFLNSSCDKIIAVSNSVATKLKEIGIEHQKIIVSYNGVNTDLFKPTKKTKYAHNKFDIHKNSHVVAMIGAIDPRKGHELFINAAKHTVLHDPNIHFLIIGNHPENQKNYQNYLFELISTLGLSDNITFTGYQNHIEKILNSIDLLIQPSETDAGPLVPLESMSCGTPVIATNVGGNPEEISHGNTGIIIPLNDPNLLGESIIKLIHDPVLMSKMRHNARKWIKSKFDSTLLTDSIETIYDELLKTK